MKRRPCRGVAVIEFALVLVLFSAILASFLYFGRLAMERAVLDRATTDAARYLASVPVEQLRDSTRRAAALAQTRALVEQALAGSGIQAADLQVGFVCGVSDCAMVTQSTPLQSVRVSTVLAFSDSWFGAADPIELVAFAEAGRDN